MIKMNLKVRDTNKSLYAIVLFIGIFMPCLIRVRMQYIMLGIEVAYIVLKVISTRKIKIYNVPVKMLACFLPFYIYYTILVVSKIVTEDAYSSVYRIEYSQSLSIATYVIALAIAMMLYKQQHEINSTTFFQIITIPTVIQLVFVGLSFLFPSVKSFFNSLTIKNSFNDTIINVMNSTWYMEWRAYGLAENVFDGFGFVISILISSVFLYGLSTKKKKITVLAWVMLIMPLLNARTGLVLCFVSFMYIMFKYLNVKRAFSFCVLIAFLIIAFLLLFKYLPHGLQDALSRGVVELKGLAQGENVGVFNQIFGVDIVFPENVLFGAGISPERITSLTGIDSGYIQSFWRFGIIGTVLLWGGYIASIVIAYRNTGQKSNKVILVVLLLIMIVYCFKLFLFNSYANNFLLFFILFSIGLEERRSENIVFQLIAG